MLDIIGTTLIATATGAIVGYLLATSLHQRRVKKLQTEYIKGVCEECGVEVTYTRSTAKLVGDAKVMGVKTTVTCSDCTEERMLNEADID